MSVGEWLDNVILDSALDEGIDPTRRPTPASGHFGEPDTEREPQPSRRPRWESHEPSSSPEDDQHDRNHHAERPRAAAHEAYAPRSRAHHPLGDLEDRLPFASTESRNHLRHNPAVDQELAEVNERLDSLTRQLSQFAEMSAANAERPSRDDQRPQEPPRQLTDAICKLDRRVDELIAEGRSAKAAIEQRVDAVDRAVADLSREKQHTAVVADPPTPLDQALMEIADRQRTLDGYAPVGATHATVQPPTPSESLPRARTQELSGLEQQLRQINTQIETLKQPCGLDKALDTLRDDLAEIGVMLQEAMPRKAVEALEGEVRKLADRIDHTRDAGADGAALTGIERGLAEVRDALRALTPAENLVGVDRAMQELSQKIDLIAGTTQDPSTLRQFESAITAMRGIASHVASNDALANLSDEVRGLAHKVDQVAGTDMLSALEERIAMLADALASRNHGSQGASYELEAVVRGLTDKIERIQLTRGDQAALGHLEDRIAKLVEKLDASDNRLNHLEAIERGLAELLIHLEHQRVPNLARGGTGAPEVDALSRDVAELRSTDKKTQDTLEIVHGTLGHVVDRLAMIETDMRGKPSAGAPPSKATLPAAIDTPSPRPTAPTLAPASVPKAAAPEPESALALAPGLPLAPMLSIEPVEPIESSPAQATKSPPPAERRPIDPNLPPDHPLEPGSGATRGRNPGSPADRIAASEAALAGAKPPVIPDPGGKSNFIAAARRAAQAAGRDAPAKKEPSPPSEIASAAGKLASRVGKLRALIAGGSAVLLLLGLLQIGRTLLGATDEAGLPLPSMPSQTAASEPENAVTPTPTPAAGEGRAPAASPAPAPAPAPPASAPAPSNRQSTLFPAVDATTIATPAPGIVIPLESAPTAPAPKAGAASPAAEVTGSVSQPAKPAAATPVAPPAAAAAAPPVAAQTPTPPASPADRLPAAFGGTLRAAAAKGEAAAQYEIAARYADGRGIPQNLGEAAEWFERAAKQGLVPAQFRLGGLYEKGLGVKKSLENARRFYVTAGEAGNAKALHNLAVLYAEGIDGKPDYQTAARWFRKAADYGVTDSQYNLAVLYARGIGVEQNLAEAYRWFALAAREGDVESAKKRDDVGARLDPQALQAATQAVQAWKAEPQPEAAVQVKTPAGGWDPHPPSVSTLTPTLTPTKRKPMTISPKLDLATPRAAQ